MTRTSVSEEAKAVIRRNTEEVQGGGNFDLFEQLFADDFLAFCQMMGDDEEAIRQVLTVFTQSTAEDMVLMNTCIEESKYVEAQDLCHKMLPMFTQLERDTTFLAKMNTLRGQGKKEKHYRHWKDDAQQFMTQADELMDLLAEKYGIG